jgi:hypothetical protein
LLREAGDGFLGVTFYFLPADIVSQILNFGLPAPHRHPGGGAQHRRQPQIALNLWNASGRLPVSPIYACNSRSISQN